MFVSVWTVHERKYLCLVCTIICAIYLQTLAQRTNWKCWLFIIGQPLLFTSHSFFSIQKPRKNAHLMGSIKINYFVISKIIVWFSSAEYGVWGRKNDTSGNIELIFNDTKYKWMNLWELFRRVDPHHMIWSMKSPTMWIFWVAQQLRNSKEPFEWAWWQLYIPWIWWINWWTFSRISFSAAKMVILMAHQSSFCSKSEASNSRLQIIWSIWKLISSWISNRTCDKVLRKSLNISRIQPQRTQLINSIL